jgi:hypothetical protein
MDSNPLLNAKASNVKIMKSGFLQKRSKYLKLWKR